MAGDHDNHNHNENGEGAVPADSRGTRLVHAGRAPLTYDGFVNPPVFRGSTVLFPDAETLETGGQRYTYGRRGNPTVTGLEAMIAELEGGARTVLVSSGLAAVTAVLTALTRAGDHVLVADTVYKPTRQFCDTTLARFGVEVTYFDPLIGAGIAAHIRANTRVVYCETPGSQTFEMLDLPAVCQGVRGAPGGDAISVVTDNTWASPLYCNPFALGADVSIQAGTKYIVGHADAMLGAVTANARAAEIVVPGIQNLGHCAGSEEVYLGMRGMRTLEVRMRQHWHAGLEVARWLDARGEVDRVLHPALESFPGHDVWKRDFSGASGLFSFILKAPVSRRQVHAFLNALRLFGMGFSWGGFESLAVPFDPSSYRTATTWSEPGQGIRIHIGLEDTKDLMADLDQAFAAMARATRSRDTQVVRCRANRSGSSPTSSAP